MTFVKVGFIGFGEVASVLSKSLRENGAEVAAYDVLFSEDKGREILLRRARVGGIHFCPLPDLVQSSDYVLSTVTTQAAIKVAQDCAGCLKPGQAYVDLNSTAPAVKVEIARTIQPTGANFVEGAILEPVGVTGAKTQILTGGEKGREVADTLTQLGLNVSHYSLEIGKASAFKMLRSIFSKGLEALVLELLIAAKRAGIEQDLWNDIMQFMSENEFDQIVSNWVRSHALAHERRYHEMVQVAGTMRELGVDPLMTASTESFFERSGSLGLKKAFPEEPASMQAVIEFMERRLRDG